MKAETMQRVAGAREAEPAILSPYAPWETGLEGAMARMLMTACRDLNPHSRISASIVNAYLTDCLRWLIAFNAESPVLTALDTAWPDEGALELGHVIPDDFERWLVEKWLTEVRSPEFRGSAECEHLRAQWERAG